MGTTTIQIDAKTRERLARLKAASGDTYDSLLNKLLALVPEGDEEGLYTDAFRIGLLESQLDIRAGNLVSHDEVKRRLGL